MGVLKTTTSLFKHLVTEEVHQVRSGGAPDRWMAALMHKRGGGDPTSRACDTLIIFQSFLLVPLGFKKHGATPSWVSLKGELTFERSRLGLDPTVSNMTACCILSRFFALHAFGAPLPVQLTRSWVLRDARSIQGPS